MNIASLRYFIIRSLIAVAFIFPNSSKESFADGPADNIPASVRPIPPAGIEISDSVRKELLGYSAKIHKALSSIAKDRDAERAEILVFARALELAVEGGTIYSEAEIEQARSLVPLALQRAEAVRTSTSSSGKPNWLKLEMAEAEARDEKKNSQSTSTLIVGGFRSAIDGSVQPYGLVVPKSIQPDATKPLRLDVWLHGRGERNLEVQFLHQRLHQVGEISPQGTIVLHPFGRYSNAFKFAGEIDILEAIAHVKTMFPIDDAQINIRGFSMGGAGCWQMAVHYPDMWMAATPGAGFCETRQFLSSFQQEEFLPTDYQESMLHWYDCPDWGNNLRYLPTLAYSGELDKQKQAADLMEQTLKQLGIPLVHLIGPQTAHQIHPDAKSEIETRLERLSQQASTAHRSVPQKIDFTTYTLRYHRNHWLSMEGLEHHWKEARVQAERDGDQIVAKTQNVTRLTLGPFGKTDNGPQIKTISIDGNRVPWNKSVPSMKLIKIDAKWSAIEATEVDEPNSLRKRPGLQGPIDDAFMTPFIFVRPDEVQSPLAVDRWVASEFAHATMQWRSHFRGDVIAKSSNEVTPDDMASKNLVLFGTPKTNPFIAKVMENFPFVWNESVITVQGNKHPSPSAAIVAIYPSPFANDRYVVINSGFTFREYAYLNNARQIPMLPDWAIVDVTDGATSQLPGRIISAGFFDESWK